MDNLWNMRYTDLIVLIHTLADLYPLDLLTQLPLIGGLFL